MKRPAPGGPGAKVIALEHLIHDHPFLRRRGVGPRVAEDWGVGLCLQDPIGKMSGRIVFPVRRACGDLLGYAGLNPERPFPASDPTPWVLSSDQALDEALFGIERVYANPAVTQVALRYGLRLVENPLEVLRAVQQMRIAVVSPPRPTDLEEIKFLRETWW